MTPNEYLFLRWMSENHPKLLAAAEDEVKKRSSLSGITDSLTNILNSVSAGLQTYVQTKEQAKLVKTNVERAAQGLAPVTASGQPYTVSPSQMQTRTLPGNIPVWALVGGGLVLLYVLTRK